MNKYIITTESGSDLSKEIIDRYNIQVIPMHVTMDDQTYPDGSIEVQKIFELYEETGILPKSSGSTPQDNTEVFKKVFVKYPDAHIIHIAYSAITTVSFNSAKIAAQDLKMSILLTPSMYPSEQLLLLKQPLNLLKIILIKALKILLLLSKIFVNAPIWFSCLKHLFI